MKVFASIALFVGLAAAVTSNDKSDAETAPMSCDEYESTMRFQKLQLDACRSRCRPLSAQLEQTSLVYQMYCSSQTPSPSPSLAPSFPPGPCKCMNYGSVIANTLVAGDYSGSSDTEGKLYVGGNAFLKGYSVGEDLDVDCDQTVLSVGGALDYKSGRVYSGNIVHGPGSNVPVGIVDGLPQGCSVTESATHFNFAGAMTHYQSVSTALCAAEDTGIVSTNGKQLEMSYSNVPTEVYTISCKNFTAAQSISFDGMSDSATVVLNLRGDSCVLDTDVIAANASNILFNLCDATSLKIQKSVVHGSILAPSAAIDGKGGVVNGQIVAQSMTGATQQNNDICHVCTDPLTAGSFVEEQSTVRPRGDLSPL